jgi:hypothetical protein
MQETQWPDAQTSIRVVVPHLPWSESHGFSTESDDGGMTLLYIGVSRAIRAQTFLVIGSGSGFIPLLFADNSQGIVVLVDAMLPDPGGGSPSDAPGVFYRLEESGRVSTRENLVIVRGLSETFLKFCIRYGITFDLVFIDGDHSTEGFKSDLALVSQVVRQHQGAVICHDANQPNIQAVLSASGTQHVRFQMAAGCAVFVTEDPRWVGLPPKPNSIRDAIISLQAEIEEAMIQSDGERWDYLTDDLFEQRMRKYFEFILMSGLQIPNCAEILEIGGNPSPLIREFVRFSEEQNMNFSFTSIEPLISQVASSTFESLRSKGLRLVTRIDNLPDDFTANVVLLCGLDLSLARTYSELESEFLKIRRLIRGSNLIFVEFPDYEPSRRLFELLSADLQLVCSDKFAFGEDSSTKISLTTQFTTRNAFVCKPASSNSDVDPTDILVSYAKIHGIPGTPLRDLTSTELSGDYESVFALFDAFPIETVPTTGERFVWLRKTQRIRFPRFSRKLEFELAWSIQTFAYRQSDLNIECDGQTLRIKRGLRASLSTLDYILQLPSFVPNQLDSASSDSRLLTVPIKSFRFQHVAIFRQRQSRNQKA